MATITSTNPIVQKIIAGEVPAPARLAAAKGMLPLPQADLLEVLVALSRDEDVELAAAAQETLQNQAPEEWLSAAQATEVAPAVLGYLAGRKDLPTEVHEAVAQNQATPDEAIALLAQTTTSGSLIELLIINQQRLIRAPAIIDAVLVNPARTPEAERRVKEVQEEFFQKERGAARIAEELRRQGKKAAAEFVESVLTAESTASFTVPESQFDAEELTTDDLLLLAEYIEVDDEDIDDSWLDWDTLEELLEESDEQRAAMAARILGDLQSETSALFETHSFRDIPSLAQRLRARQDPVSDFLYALLSSALRNALAAPQPQGDTLLAGLIKENFNEIIQRQKLFSEHCFKTLNLSEETTELSEQNPRDAELIRLNRLLLEDAYPKDILRNPASIARRILKMKIKQRVRAAMKGDRELRSILIRDSNKLVSGAVVRNPKITGQEIEAIAAMRSVSDEALRIIGMSRAWAQNYTVIHNLARNPRTPVAIAMNVLPRLQTRDLRQISVSRNIPDGIRRQAQRLAMTRKN